MATARASRRPSLPLMRPTLASLAAVWMATACAGTATWASSATSSSRARRRRICSLALADRA
eukprot:4559463-Prymnesium_polylepis.1